MRGVVSIGLIILGILFLGSNFNLWTSRDIETILSFWPLFLILVGLYLIVRRTKEALLVMIIALLAAAGFVYYAGFQNGLPRPFRGQEQRRDEDDDVRESKITADLDPSTERVEAEINTGAINFDIKDGTEKLIDGELQSGFLEPDLSSSFEGDLTKLKLDTVSFRRRFFFRDFNNRLSLKFNNELPLALKINTGASDLDFDLSGLRISDFLLKAGASDIDVTVGEEVVPDAKVAFEVGVSDIKVRVPKALGVKIVSESGLTSERFPSFVSKDDAFYSEGYDTAQKKIEIQLRAGASAIEVERY